MSKSYKSWMVYSAGIFIVWAVVLFVRWRLKGTPDLWDLLLVFGGFFMGWLSATIKFILVSKGKYGLLPSKSEK